MKQERGIRTGKNWRELLSYHLKSVATLCILGVITLSVLIGGVNLVRENLGQTFASEQLFSEYDNGRLPSGISGVLTSVEQISVEAGDINRIGTSCEEVMVGQRVQKADSAPTEINMKTSMESVVNRLEQESVRLANSPQMMTDEDYYWFLKIVEAEAGEGDVKSRVLVANVILNRLRREDFPNTITEVIFEYVNGVPQFSPTYDGRIYTVTVTEETKEAVKQALNGVDYSQGALFFIMKEAAEADGVSWFEQELHWLFKYGVHDYYTYK